MPGLLFKDSPYTSHFILEINVEKRQIRHRTTLKLNDEFPDRLKMAKSIEMALFKIQSLFMSDPTLSDIDFKNKLDSV